MPYETYIFEQAPGWLQGRYGEKLITTIGFMEDVLADAAREAVKARFISTTQDDALKYHASERGLERMPNETLATWRSRLDGAHAAWAKAGTKNGILYALGNVGLTDGMGGFANAEISIYTYWDWPSGDPEEWARFWVMIDHPHPFGPAAEWGGTMVWGQFTWGIDADPAVIQLLKRLVRQWKAARDKAQINIIISGVAWGTPAMVWGNGFLWGAKVAKIGV